MDIRKAPAKVKSPPVKEAMNKVTINDATPPTRKNSNTFIKLIFLYTLTSIKKTTTDNGTVREPTTISPGTILLFSNPSTPNWNINVTRSRTMNTRLYNHGLGHSALTLLISVCVRDVPLTNRSSASENECFLKTAVYKSLSLTSKCSLFLSSNSLTLSKTDSDWF